MTLPPIQLLVGYAALVAGALVGVEIRRRALLFACKPAATLVLLAIVGVPPRDPVQVLCAAAIVLSALGDAALLWEGTRSFLAGSALFGAAHLCYAAALLGGEPPAAVAWVAVVILTVPSIALVRAILPGVPRTLRVPTIVYAAVLTFMSAAAIATIGRWPAASAASAAAGALLFYASDALVAWRRFRGGFAHAQSLTLVLYWAGQLGIALALRAT